MALREYVHELGEMVDQAHEAGDLMRTVFHDPDYDLGVTLQDNGTFATKLDIAISLSTRDKFGNVACEQGDPALHTISDGYCSSPVDATHNLITEREKEPRHSIAAFSLARVIMGEPVSGAVTFPLLSSRETGRRTYSALRDHGVAVEIAETDSDPYKLSHFNKRDTEATTGVVLVSDTADQWSEQLRRQGFTPCSAPGAVFKAMCVIDPNLARLYESNLVPPGQEVVGFLDEKARPPAYLATSIIGAEAGVWSRGLDAKPLTLDYERPGCVFARSVPILNRLLEVAQSPRI